MIVWPDQLITNLARRRAVLFLGAGVSANAVGDGGISPPTWREFLDKGLTECPKPNAHIKRLLSEGDYLTACEIIKQKLDEGWKALLEKNFVAPKYQPAPIHTHLYNVDAPLVLTPNFDKIYDNFAQNESKGTIRTKTYEDDDLADIVRNGIPTVLKIHGTIDKPSGMIFTRSEYLRARREHAAFFSLMDALMVTHTFLFLGCSLNDPDMRLFLERNVQLFPGTAPHYIAMAKPVHVDVGDSIRENLNLKVLPYAPKEGHKELIDSLEEMVARVDGAREELSKTQTW